MKGVLLLNGEPYAGKISCGNARVVCCDGAYAWAKGRVPIDENVGDFDSLRETPYPLPAEVYPSEKNDTDGEIGLKKLLEAGCDEITIYGGGGGREDHFLGNLHLLYAAYRQGVQATMITNHARIYVSSGRTYLRAATGDTVSLFPFGGDAHIMDSKGLKYPLRALTLTYGSCRGVSNVVLSGGAFFDCAEGVVLVFEDSMETARGL